MDQFEAEKNLGATVEDRETERGWQPIETSEPPVQIFTPGLGWSAKPYVLTVDAKGRMAVGYFHRYSTGQLGFTSAKPTGPPTHWMPLPDPPEVKD